MMQIVTVIHVKNFSRAYIRHLFNANEILGLRLATLHNIHFYMWLTGMAREKILAGGYLEWKRKMISQWQDEAQRHKGTEAQSF